MSPTSTINSLLFSPSAAVRYGGNYFINVPTILQVEGTPLIETVSNNEISRTTRFSIFHCDGILLATVIGTTLFRTAEGEKAGLEIKYPSRLTICTMGDRILFEVRRIAAASIAITAELFSPDGLLVKSSSEVPPAIFTKAGRQIAGASIRDRWIRKLPVGFSVTEEGRNITLGGK